MTVKSQAMFRRIIDQLSETVNLSKTARLCRVDPSTIRIWQRASKADADAKVEGSEWLVEIDGETRFFHEWCSRTATAVIDDIIANAFVRARDGTDVETKFQGSTVYKLSPDWIDEGMRDLLGLTDADKYLRDAKGKLVPETSHEEPPVQLVEFILGAHRRPMYGKHTSQDVKMSLNARVAGGVQFIGGAPRQATIAAPLPVLELVTDVEPDDAPEINLEVTSTDPDAPITANLEEDFTPAPKPMATEPEPVIQTATPSEYAPAAIPLLKSQREGRPLSELERSLLSELPGALNR
jgi:hypothetical protein